MVLHTLPFGKSYIVRIGKGNTSPVRENHTPHALGKSNVFPQSNVFPLNTTQGFRAVVSSLLSAEEASCGRI
jgi:hypothetical protein